MSSVNQSGDRIKTGGKRPRSEFRNLERPANFSIVNFLTTKGKKTAEQEIVPTLWIVNGKNPMCHWPKDTTISRRSLDHMVASEEPPSKEKFMTFPIRILKTGLTLPAAKEAYECLATKSNSEEVDEVGGSHSGSDAEMESSESETSQESSQKKKKKKSSKTPAKKKTNLNKLPSFEFVDDDDDDDNNLIDPNNVIMNGSTSNSVHSPLNSKYLQTPVNSMTLFSGHAIPKSNSNRDTIVSHENNVCSSTGDHGFITRGEFKVFEAKLFHKLNSFFIKFEENRAAQLLAFPPSVSEKCTLPGKDIHTLEVLDDILKDKTIRAEIAKYLSQLGGKSTADFLSRALNKVMVDELCYLTNWSGSAIPANSVDHNGDPITREFKKTFSNLLNVIAMFCESCRLVDASATDAQVESYIKKWLLHFKDRLAPRKHNPKSDAATIANKSPRKKKARDM